MSSSSQFLLCVANDDCDDLQVRKVYRQLADRVAATKGFVRVIDDSGEDYLYPESFFAPLPLSRELAAKLEGLKVEPSRT